MTRTAPIVVLLFAAAALPAAAQPARPPAAAAPPNHLPRASSRRAGPRNALVALARDADPVNRQCAMLQLAEGNPPTSEETEALIRGLADANERVRLQAAAGLMRLGELVMRSSSVRWRTSRLPARRRINPKR